MFVTEKTCCLCNVFMKTDGNFLKLKTRYHSWCNDCRKKKKKKWNEANKDYVNQAAKEWHYLNYAKYKEKKIAYQSKWQKENLEKVKQYRKKCYQNNKIKSFANSAKYRARKRNAVPNWMTQEMQFEIETLYKIAKELTKNTGISHEVDHIIPLKSDIVCGLHVPWNMQVLTRYENRSKRNYIKE